MERIKQLAQGCLGKQPKLNNITGLLLDLLSSEHEISLKEFIAKELTNVFEVLHKRGQFDSTTQQFLRQKNVSLLLLLAQLVENGGQFQDCITRMIEIIEAKQIISASENHPKLWNYLTNFNKTIEVCKELISSDSNIKIQFILRLPEQNFDVIEQQQKQGTMIEETDSKFKKEFQKIVFSILKDNSLDDNIYKTIVESFPEKIFPKILSPLHLSEHIYYKYSNTINLQLKISLLSCLFILIGKYGLEVENFYTQLYNLVEMRDSEGRSVFEAANSKKVLKMIQNSLRSSKVGFNILVKFIKSLINRCLFQNTSFVCWVMALSFNLFKKHQLLSNCLNVQSEMYIPEFSIIQTHFLPQIQSLVKKLQKSLNREEFLDVSEFSTIDLQRALKHQIQGIKEAKILIPNTIEDLLV